MAAESIRRQTGVDLLEARLRDAIFSGTRPRGVSSPRSGVDAVAAQLADVEVRREPARSTGNRVYLLLRPSRTRPRRLPNSARWCGP
ncbi:hypothetical protein AB0N14_26715 [Streptomyces sp. NPDC051104]|uniref:hypothetical protein n=1 Tax=Streptomyces sp. NPDC051104 TaxID=3155044 RepID=UPI00342AD349